MNIFTHTDLYQINMAYSYFKEGIHEQNATFEVFFRHSTQTQGHHIFAGLERIISIIQDFKINELEIKYLRENMHYSDDFLKYLENLRFTGNIKSVIEGEIVYFNEPLMIINAPLIEAQLLETIILNIINYQTLIATKASLIRQSAPNQTLLEFGARRAYELDGALYAARSSYIGGFDGTSLVSAGIEFDIPISGTHAHSFVQVHENEYEAFKAYAKSHKNCVFLIDTYDVLESGIKNAIKVADEFGNKINFLGVRLDSGDLAYLSAEVRKILDEHGYNQTSIIASNDLDADTILTINQQGGKIDTFGIGTKLVSSSEKSSLGCVYKLVRIEDRDVIKISNNSLKSTYPGLKKVYRMYNTVKNEYKGDLIVAEDQNLDLDKIDIYNQYNELYTKDLRNIEFINLHHDIYVDGKLCYKVPSVSRTKEYVYEEKQKFYKEQLRFKNPHIYYVSYSQSLFDNKQKLIQESKNARTDN